MPGLSLFHDNPDSAPLADQFAKEEVLAKLQLLDKRAARKGLESLDPTKNKLIPIGTEIDAQGRVTKNSYGVFHLAWRAEAAGGWPQQVLADPELCHRTALRQPLLCQVEFQLRQRFDLEPAAELPSEDDDILELTQVVPEPEPAPPPQRPRPVLIEPDNDIAFDATPPAPEPRYTPEPEFDEGLVADEVIERAGAAFGRLHRDTALTETVAGNSIEGLVRQILKPLLKQWLDEHLPDIVESIVREEVARAASRRR